MYEISISEGGGTIFDVEEVLSETLTYCHGRLQNLEIKLIKDIEPNLRITGKRVQISQILLNLLNNAIDALSEKNDKRIMVSSRFNEGFVEIRVQDSGDGVPVEIETKIMQPFYITKEIGKGIGLGLSVSFAIAKQHRGSLSIDRSVTSSCFLLRIPIEI